MLKHFVGAPYQLRSDNGPHFITDLIREFLLLIGVKHCLTLAYSKEENAIVERYNKKINRHLRALTYDNSSLTDYKKGGPPSLLHTYWRGRVRVVNSENSRYTLFDLVTNKEKDYHVSDMKPLPPTSGEVWYHRCIYTCLIVLLNDCSILWESHHD